MKKWTLVLFSVVLFAYILMRQSDKIDSSSLHANGTPEQHTKNHPRTDDMHTENASPSPEPAEATLTPKPHSHSHDHPSTEHQEDEEPFDRNVLFEEPEMDNNGHFVSVPRPVKWDTRCQEVGLDTFADGRTLAATESLQGTESLPTDHTVLNWNRYYHGEGLYYQIFALWNGQIPPMYKVEIFRSESTDPSADFEVLHYPNINGEQLSWSATMERIESFDQEMSDQGTKLGSRTMIVAPAPIEDVEKLLTESTHAEYRNGKLIRLNSRDRFCAGESELICYCPDKQKPPVRDSSW